MGLRRIRYGNAKAHFLKNTFSTFGAVQKKNFRGRYCDVNKLSKEGRNCKPFHNLELVQMEDYVVLGRIGEGAHGIVMKGRHKKSGSIVALKKVLIKRLEDGIPETALREIKALQVGLFCL